MAARSALTYRIINLLALAAGLIAMEPMQRPWAGELCPGKYHVLPLRTWPSRVALNVPLVTRNAAGQSRAKALRAGLQQSGLHIDAATPLVLQLVFSVASSGDDEDVYTGLDWHRVDAEFSSSLKDPTLPNSSLSLTAIVNDSSSRRNILVATMHCTMKTDDSEALAREIGIDLGRAITSTIRPGR